MPVLIHMGGIVVVYPIRKGVLWRSMRAVRTPRGSSIGHRSLPERRTQISRTVWLHLHDTLCQASLMPWEALQFFWGAAYLQLCAWGLCEQLIWV